MKVEFLPIKTANKPPLQKYKAWLVDQRRVRLLEPFLVPRPTGGFYIIPGRFEFDGGSVPRWLLVLAVIGLMFMPPNNWVGYALVAMILTGLLIERFGLMLMAFAIHDFSVRYRLLVNDDGTFEEVKTVGAANTVMRDVNFATNDMIVIGWVAHIAMVLGAWRAWRQHETTPPAVDWRSLDYGVQLKP